MTLFQQENKNETKKEGETHLLNRKKKRLSLVFLLFPTNQTRRKKIKKASIFTEIIDRDSSVGEPPGGLLSVEIAAVGKAVGSGEGAEEIVGAAVDEGVSYDEQRRGQRSLQDRASRGIRRGRRGRWRYNGEANQADRVLRVLESCWLWESGEDEDGDKENKKTNFHCFWKAGEEKRRDFQLLARKMTVKEEIFGFGFFH